MRSCTAVSALHVCLFHLPAKPKMSHEKQAYLTCFKLCLYLSLAIWQRTWSGGSWVCIPVLLSCSHMYRHPELAFRKMVAWEKLYFGASLALSLQQPSKSSTLCVWGVCMGCVSVGVGVHT